MPKEISFMLLWVPAFVLTIVLTNLTTPTQAAPLTRPQQSVSIEFNILTEWVGMPAPATVGTEITYTYLIRVFGIQENSPTSIRVEDKNLGIVVNDTQNLPPNTLVQYITTTQLAATWLNSSSTFTNIVLASVNFDNQFVTATAEISIPVDITPSMQLEKTANVDQAIVGQTVIYSYTIYNDGNVIFTTTSLIDDKLGIVAEWEANTVTFSPGESAIFTKSTTVSLSDMPELVNTATLAAYNTSLGIAKLLTDTVVIKVFTDTIPAEFSCDFVTDISATECEGLVAFYNSTNGSEWFVQTNWLSETIICNNWYGVACFDSSGVKRVTGLSLAGNGLKGQLPAEIEQLPYLTDLDFNSNHLTGPISELLNLHKLKRLRLGSNELQGEIPAELATITSLTTIDLGQNQIHGSIPINLAELPHLTELFLDENQLTGEIPAELGQLTNLDYLNLYSNTLTGAIPTTLSNAKQLTNLNLGRNQLTGNIPAELGTLSQLTELYLFDNNLTGSIPQSFGDLTKLEVLNLAHNQLTDEIPTELGNVSQLVRLYLFDNQLTGPIPQSLGNLTQTLQILYLGDNQLTGQIPEELGNLQELTLLYLNDNQLTGPIPSSFGNLTNLQHLYLPNNRLSGEIPPELGNLSNLDTLKLASNPNLTGALPQSFVNLINLENFYFYETELCRPDNEAFLRWLNAVDAKVAGENVIPAPNDASVCHEPITGLQLISSSPTILGEKTYFTATVTSGSNIQYFWTIEGITVGPSSSDRAENRYNNVGQYIVTVKAENDTSSMTVSTRVFVMRPPTAVFSELAQTTPPNNTQAVSMADLDGDGDLDVFNANRQSAISQTRQSANSPANEIWLNDGAGKFVKTGQSLGIANSNAVALGDIDGDGDIDAMVGNDNNQPNEVWLNDGSGIFTQTQQPLFEADTNAVVLIDIDQDNDLDAVIGTTAGQNNTVFLNDGTGVFTATTSLGNSGSNAVVLGDVDNDNDLDAIIGTDSDQPNEVWLNDGNGVFTQTQQPLGNNNSQAVVLGDVDNDGDLDALIGTNNDHANEVWLNDGNGVFTQTQQPLGNSGGQAISLGDMDNDGNLDVMIANDTTNEVWLNDGSGVFTNTGQQLGEGGSNAIVLGDIDNDGDIDLFVGNDGSNEVFLNQNQKQQLSPATGAVIDFTEGQTITLTIPDGVFSQTTHFVYTALSMPHTPYPESFVPTGRNFQLEAFQGDTPISGALNGALTMRIYYDDVNITPETARLFYWQADNGWQDVMTTCTVTTTYRYGTNWAEMELCHLTDFALFAQETSAPKPDVTYLPIITR